MSKLSLNLSDFQNITKPAKYNNSPDLTIPKDYDHDKHRGGEEMELLWYFFAGFFAWNGVPHLVKGITGQTHMTPFAKVSSPVLNVIWAFVNLVIMMYLLGVATGVGGFLWPWEANLAGMNAWAFVAGGLLTAAYLASFWSNPKAKLPWQ